MKTGLKSFLNYKKYLSYGRGIDNIYSWHFLNFNIFLFFPFFFSFLLQFNPLYLTNYMSIRPFSEGMTPRPSILDVVSLDKAWHQVHGGGELVRDLNSNVTRPIDWDEYRLTKRFGLYVYLVNNEEVRKRLGLDSNYPTISEDEIKLIHWSDEVGKEELKGWVTLFGFYEHK